MGFNDLFTNENIRSVCERPESIQYVIVFVDFDSHSPLEMFDSHSRFCANSPNLNFVTNPTDIERPGIGLIYIYLFFEGIIFFILTILIEVCEI